MEFINTLFFGIYPYIATGIFFLGSLLRYDREQYSWKTGSSQMLSSKNFRIANVLFHVGIIMILLGHFAGLVLPWEIWHALGISLPAKQLIAMGVGGFFGVLCFIGLTMLVKRRLFDPRIRANSSKMDTVILLLIYLQLIVGLVTIVISSGHMDGAVMYNLMSWSRYLLTFRPVEAVEFISSVHPVYKFHVALGITLFVLFPFSRLVHIWSIPVQYVRRSYQIVRQKA
ncbi:respiratory nitrate reductase subunit gamma [Aestuariibacter halophilus]|uniref:Respiratory nitrate reductase subunit gamma n=1 Tax=Fluctibacter halophilus TaxID=226011 RepID=A0ABS8G3F5_9ALTE|nr:respiratory nitrate reductase subunit gamma [Aestuariibacter halophilus]MCC2615070.1 respiratory nitrate reductase subunit gamma [Aestuariibacter halophilus]